MLYRLFQFGVLVAGVFICCGSDWSRFRGPNGSGISCDEKIPVVWSDKHILWRTPIAGLGNSSPIVCGDQVFLQTASEDGAQRTLVCMSVRDGVISWTRTLLAERAKTHKLNSLASSTPAADSARVYAAFWDGKNISLWAFDMEGEPQWKQDLGPFASQHGPGTSPIVFDRRVYFANDQDGASTVYAFDAATGKIDWKATRKPFRTSYATPFVLVRKGKSSELIVASTAGITSYAPESGKENWNWTWNFNGEPLRCVGLPQFDDDLFFVSAGDGDGRRSAAVTKYAMGIWQSDKRTFPYVPSAIIWDKHIYFVTDKGFACCVSAATGEQVWMERLSSSDFFASPVLVDGKVYAISDEGICYVFAAKPAFALLGKSSIGERVKASPAVSKGKLFIRGETHLFCIGFP